MQLTLLVPGLLLPAAIRPDTVFDLTAPALSRLLGRGTRLPLTDRWPAGAFGLTTPLPAAALRKVGAGGAAPGDWICVDPVPLQVTREGVILADPAELQLTPEESAQLIEALAPLFADWGTLTASAPACWELQLRHPIHLDTRPLPDGIGQPVAPQWPAGPDGRAWRHLLATAQTVLHAHPVNRNRDQQRRLICNSLWPWGAGALPQDLPANFNVIWSDDPVIAGLGAQAGIPCLVSPGGFQPASGRVLAIDTRMLGPARMRNALDWRANLQTLERDWIAPALTALKKGLCAQIRLIGDDIHDPACTAWTLNRKDLWHIWRRPRPLMELA